MGHPVSKLEVLKLDVQFQTWMSSLKTGTAVSIQFQNWASKIGMVMI